MPEGRSSAASAKVSEATAGDADTLVLSHVFDAPRALVYAAWTERQHLERWQGAPEGMTVTVEQSDIRPGGAFKICMHGPDGADHWLQGVYREVVAPERLVFTHTWLDASGKPGKETLVTITFTERGDRTELTLRQSGFASIQSRDGHREGWASTFTNLARYLSGNAARHSSGPRKS
jgi:uncharacterized protein YndB with AHSA1/START domain